MTAPNIVFPKSGNHGGEHLAFALKIRGIDDWTRKFFQEDWVEAGMAGILQEISESTASVVISSERLAGLSPEEIRHVVDLFPDFEKHVIIVRRDVEKYLRSTWRHAVYRHDFAKSFESFAEHMAKFEFGQANEKFEADFEIHNFVMEDSDYVTSLESLLETTLIFPHSNEGVPFEFASHLQKLHVMLGSEKFKKVFDANTKAQMLNAWNGKQTTVIDPFNVPLF